MRFVLDASVTLAWFIDNPIPNYALQVRQTMLSGSNALVPALWHLEIANALAVAERRKIIKAADVAMSVTQLEQLLAQYINSSNDFISLKQALTTARAFQISAYDAVYLDTARNEGLPLATLDKSLRSASIRAGLGVL
jgi:predicted nucleic acid-binding protein